MKKKLSCFLALLLALSSVFAQRGKVTILYTNDVHSYIMNTKKDSEGNKVPGLSYSSVAAYRDELKNQGEQVALVDAGDHVQGTAYGAMDEGASIIRIMNAVKYDIATIGNHEFDYGTKRLFKIIKEAKFPYVSCNFVSEKNGKPVVSPYKILSFGKTKVAFIGIMTPETYTKSTPAYFMDESQSKFIYKILAGEDGKELYDSVQKAINEVSSKADYVVAIGHLGDDPSSAPWRSVDVIAATSGLDAFIDGHSHSTNPMQLVKDASGKEVVLTQTGSYFGAIGKLTLTDEKITSELITEYEPRDEKIDSLVSQWAGKVDSQLNRKIAVSDVNLYINNPEDSTKRLIRRQETNLGDLVADGTYYFFNEVEKIPCDFAIANGGGIRVDVPAGEFTYNSAKKVQPFGNVLCLVEVSGQELLDALEFGARKAGSGENGGFLHVAGLKYTIDTSIPDTVKTDDKGIWLSAPSKYRVCDVQVYNKASAQYEILDLGKTYVMGGSNYTLRHMGDGYGMLAKTKLLKDYCGEDYLAACAYIKDFAKSSDGLPHISSKNSPLASYENYLINYESPSGSQRITIK